MIISKNKIIKIEKYLNNFEKNKKIQLLTRLDNTENHKLEKYGLKPDGIFRVPKGIKTYTKLNIKGQEKIYKDKPKEDYSYLCYYNILDWHGQSHDGYCIHTIKRYQRELILPEEIEISVKNNIARSDYFTNTEANFQRIKLAINIFLEIFGNCEIVYKDDFNNFSNIKKREVPWEILPKGVSLNTNRKLKSFLNKIKPQNVKLIIDRLNFYSNLNPESVIIGINQFDGYIIFKFNNFYFCDSNNINNAIYVFDQNWEEFSKLTKKEILEKNLQRYRIFHHENWKSRVLDIIKKGGKYVPTCNP